MDEQNLYVNHLASFDLSQNSRKHYLADKKQSSNCSQETEYVEIGADSKDKKIKQEDFILRKRTETNVIYFLLTLSIFLAVAALAVACMALVKISTLSMTSTDIKLVQEIEQKLVLTNERLNDNARSISSLNSSTKEEIERIDKNAMEQREHSNNKFDTLQHELEIIEASIITEISNISTALNQGYLELEDGWISPLNGFQYKRTFINQSWSENRNICQSWGGDLASHGIQDFYTRNALDRALSLTFQYFYIGLSDKFQNRHYHWLNGYELDYSDSLWYVKPSQSGYCGIAQFDCAIGSVTIVPCSRSYQALCEKQI